MNILFCCIVPQSELYLGLAKEYKRRGHNVTFLTPGKNSLTHWGTVNGFQALYFECGPVLSSNILKKGIANLRFPKYALEATKKYLNAMDYDLILMSTPPLGYFKVVKYLKRINKQLRFYLILRDIHPEGAKFIHLHFVYPLYRYFQKQAISLYNSADIIGCMSPHSVNLIQNRYLQTEKDKVQLLPNWGDDIEYTAPDTAVLEKYGLQGKFILIYGGHIGILQNLQIFVKLANEKKNLKDVIFLIIGFGPEKEKLKRMVNDYGLDNVRIMDYMPHEDYMSVLKTAKVGIISLHPKSYFANIPSKTISYFQNKIPILASIDSLGDYKTFIIEQSKAGLWSLADDFDTLSKNFDRLYNEEQERQQMGENGYHFFKDHLTVEKAVDTMFNQLKMN